MTQDRARKQAIRARMAQTGEPFSVAARNLDAAASPAPPMVSGVANPYDVSTAILQYWDDSDELERAYRQHREAGGTDQVWNQAVEIARADRAAAGDTIAADELGAAALPPDATPAQRARAEALWHPVTADQPCRCSRPCRHSEACTDEDTDDGQRCPGRIVHVDRQPGSLFSVIVWADAYQCDTCGEQVTVGCVELPAIPWGEYVDRDGHRVLTAYDDVRHPNIKDTWPGYDPEAGTPAGDGVCRGCGSYALAGYLCDGCRAEGWTDNGGWVEEPDPDEREERCEECGADISMGSYDECACA
jgi:hypothetical protein